MIAGSGWAPYVHPWSPKAWQAAKTAVKLLAPVPRRATHRIYVTPQGVAAVAECSVETARIALRRLHYAGILAHTPGSGSRPAMYEVKGGCGP